MAKTKFPSVERLGYDTYTKLVNELAHAWVARCPGKSPPTDGQCMALLHELLENTCYLIAPLTEPESQRLLAAVLDARLKIPSAFRREYRRAVTAHPTGQVGSPHLFLPDD